MPSAAGAEAGAGRRSHWNRVPEVTVYFWIIKVLCTTVGETAADLAVILGLVVYLAVTRKDVARPQQTARHAV